MTTPTKVLLTTTWRPLVMRLSGSLAQSVRLIDQCLHEEPTSQKMAPFAWKLSGQSITHNGKYWQSRRVTGDHVDGAVPGTGRHEPGRFHPSGGATTTCSYGCRFVMSCECRNTSRATSYVAREIVTGGLQHPNCW